MSLSQRQHNQRHQLFPFLSKVDGLRHLYSKNPYFYVFLIMAFFFFCFQLYKLDTYTIPVIDEAWYGNTAYNISQGLGPINTAAGSRGGDELYLFTYYLSLFFSWFGTTLWAGRLSSVVLGIISLLIWTMTCKRLHISSKWTLISGVILSQTNIWYILFRRIRPEAFLITLSLLAVYFMITHVYKAAHNTDQHIPYAFGSGLILFLGFTAHPNGFLGVGLGGLFYAFYFLKTKKLAPLVYYSIGTCTGLFLFFISWTYLKEVPFTQFITESLLGSGRVSASLYHTFYTNTLTFIKEYSLGLKRGFILLFEVGIPVLGLTYYKKNNTIFILSVSGLAYLVIGLLILTPYFRWAVSPLIFFSLLICTLIMSESKTMKRYLVPLLLLYTLNNVAGNVYQLRTHANTPSFHELSARIKPYIQHSDTIAGSLELWWIYPSATFIRSKSEYGPNTPIEKTLNNLPSLSIISVSGFFNKVSPTTGTTAIYQRDSEAPFYDMLNNKFDLKEPDASWEENRYGTISIWNYSRSKN